ncbi:unnamed protein product [Didymodactylos carnosus]|uniref:Uncharacterized protein n=1 Tax=Didymodactylos carnosus TaxID=1234261 RepID=A0A814WEN6_9BILA|nr:unnamed protein product [Didymodactylos carnosus]CAF1200312.1 unnamed protein product [Didymodactylos carnosus]CAF3707383.1 unnamed protein product [Didymodactylos carnosus]CAF3964820.1 unnamed protein product [Didymodactylos carnosus]
MAALPLVKDRWGGMRSEEKFDEDIREYLGSVSSRCGMSFPYLFIKLLNLINIVGQLTLLHILFGIRLYTLDWLTKNFPTKIYCLVETERVDRLLRCNLSLGCIGLLVSGKVSNCLGKFRTSTITVKLSRCYIGFLVSGKVRLLLFCSRDRWGGMRSEEKFDEDIREYLGSVELESPTGQLLMKLQIAREDTRRAEQATNQAEEATKQAQAAVEQARFKWSNEKVQAPWWRSLLGKTDIFTAVV